MNAMSKEQKQAYAEQVAQRFLSGEFVRHKEEYGVALLEMDEIPSDHCCEIMERSGYDPYWLASSSLMKADKMVSAAYIALKTQISFTKTKTIATVIITILTGCSCGW